MRARFTAAYHTNMNPSEFVDKLFANAGVAPAGSDRAAAINEFGAVMTSDPYRYLMRVNPEDGPA